MSENKKEKEKEKEKESFRLGWPWLWKLLPVAMLAPVWSRLFADSLAGGTVILPLALLVLLFVALAWLYDV